MNLSGHDLDEALISGYLDGELTQSDAQRVRLHLEDCEACAATADELRQLKEATMTSRFAIPADMSFDEAPRSRTSRILRNVGVLVGFASLVGLLSFLAWELATDPEGLMGLLLLVAFVASASLILASVLIDRRADMKNDRYRRVKK